MKSCDVLLATYNGEEFLGALLESLLAQSNSHFRVIVRDDGSTDSTLAVIESFKDRFEGRLVVIGDGSPTGSPTLNFEILMNSSTADYILFCDQDDVWLSNRVEITLKILIEAEVVHGDNTPIFAFTDLIPVDRKLKQLSKSFWCFKKINPFMTRSLSRSLITSAVLGCSSGVNRALLNLALPIHLKATNHDWWMLHVGIIFGKVVWSSERTVLYRLHGGNSSNQKRVSLVDYAKARSPFKIVRRGLEKKAAHAGGLLENYQNSMEPDIRNLLEDFVSINDRGFFMRRIILLKWNLVYPDVRRNIAFFLGL